MLHLHRPCGEASLNWKHNFLFLQEAAERSLRRSPIHASILLFLTCANPEITTHIAAVWLRAPPSSPPPPVLRAVSNTPSPPPTRTSVRSGPLDLQRERDLRQPGVESAQELRRSAGPDVQRGVQAVRTRRPALPAVRQQHPLQPPAAEPEGNQGVHQRAAGAHQLHLRGLGCERRLAPEPRAGPGRVGDRHHQPGR